MKIKFALVILFVTLFTFGCNKDYVENSDVIELKHTTLESRASSDETAIALFYSSEVQRGRYYHSLIKNKITSYDWSKLSNGDKNIILNFTDAQFALLAIYIEAVLYNTDPRNYYSSAVYSELFQQFKR